MEHKFAMVNPAVTDKTLEKHNSLQPEEHELLIQVHATSVMPDYCIKHGSQVSSDLPSLLSSKESLVQYTYHCLKLYALTGYDFSGVVLRCGKGVKHFTVGDQVFGISYQSTLDKLIVLKETQLIRHKPNNLTFAEAAALPFGALNALYFIKVSNIQPGQKVFVYGADSAIGISAVQLARALGAEVTALCQSSNAALLRFLGATVVLEINEPIIPLYHDSFDVVLDTQSNQNYYQVRDVLKSDGIYVSAWLDWSTKWARLCSCLLGKRRVIAIQPSQNVNIDDLQWISFLAEQGKLIPVIDRLFDFNQLEDAMAYLQEQSDIGSVILQR